MITACELTITTLRVGINFAKPHADRISLQSTFILPGFTNVHQFAGVPLIVDVGDVQIDFRLNQKGHGVDAHGTCGLAYQKPTKKLPGLWKITITLHQGDWRVPLAAHGLTNQSLPKPGQFVRVPVAVLIGNEAFATDPQLHYWATVNKTGVAR